MKKFELDLSEWQIDTKVPGDDQTLVDVKVVYPFRQNLNDWLRSPGLFRKGEDIVEAITLAKAIAKCVDDVFVMDEREATILKTGVNRILEVTYDGKANLGGPVHEEAICRVFQMKEVA